MKNLLFFNLLLFIQLSFGQVMIAPATLSRNEKLAADAYNVFKTNKFLDFKDKDFMEELIDGNVYKKFDLHQFFDHKKNWDAIENETFNPYKQDRPGYNYLFANTTMTETYTKSGSYGVRREIKTVYNAKGFILSREEKISVNDLHNETRSIFNEFDQKNRVVKITSTTERMVKEENKKSVTDIVYDTDQIKITSENGTIICRFSLDKNTVGSISQLSPRETISQFMYALAGNQPELAKEHLSDKRQKDNRSLPKLASVRSMGGTDTHTSDKVMTEDTWEIEFPGEKKKRYHVSFTLIKQKNGWKIDDFTIH